MIVAFLLGLFVGVFVTAVILTRRQRLLEIATKLLQGNGENVSKTGDADIKGANGGEHNAQERNIRRTNRSGAEEDTHNRLIRRRRPYLVDRIDVNNTHLLDLLVSSGVLAQSQLDAIKAEGPSNRQRVSCLLDHLTRLPPDSWTDFIRGLGQSNNNHVAERIKEWTQGMTKRKKGPSFLFIMQSPKIADTGSDFILLQIKKILEYINPDVNCISLCENDLRVIEEEKISQVFGVLPESCDSLAKGIAYGTEKTLFVMRTTDEVPASSDVSQHVHDSYTKVYFIGEKVYQSWECHLEHSLKHETFIPAPITINSRLFVEPSTSEIWFIVDFVSAEPDQSTVDLLNDAVNKMQCKNKVSLKFVITQTSKRYLLERLESTSLAFRYSVEEFCTKEDAAKLFRNSVWLFLNKELDFSWLRYQPLLRGIPQIISTETKLYGLIRTLPPVILEDIEWKGTDALGLAALMNKCVRDPEKTYASSRLLTESFFVCPVVVESHAKLLHSCFREDVIALQRNITRATEDLFRQRNDTPSLIQEILNNDNEYQTEMSIPSDVLGLLNAKGNWTTCQLLHKLIQKRLQDYMTN